MVVNVDLMGQRKGGVPLSPRTSVSAVRLSGNEMRKHEQIMEYRNKVNALNANLKSALDALSFANADIAQLNSELECLRTQNAQLKKEIECARERARNQTAKSSSRKNRDNRAERTDSSDSGNSR